MIVVIGSPVFRPRAMPASAGIAGLAGRVALAGAGADRAVQLVGKVGDDDAGDALLVALAASGIGHAATLRDAAHPTPIVPSPGSRLDDPVDVTLADDDPDHAPAEAVPPGLPLEPADVELALRYLTDFRVVVIAAQLDPETLAAAMAAAAFASAHVIRLDHPGHAERDAAPDDAETTAFEAPPGDEPAFATMVGRYAAAIDAGRTPRDAFSDATRGADWERATPD